MKRILNFSRVIYLVEFRDVTDCVSGEQQGGDAETLAQIGVDHEN